MIKHELTKQTENRRTIAGAISMNHTNIQAIIDKTLTGLTPDDAEIAKAGIDNINAILSQAGAEKDLQDRLAKHGFTSEKKV
jgi:folate-dependent phosphoribosylglycinamide formyltransferase PurN